jgi:integrase
MEPSKKAAYNRYQRQYRQFCDMMHYTALPATPITIARYITHLASSIAPQTILVQLSALRMMHITNGLSWEWMDTPLLRYTLRGIMKTRSKPPSQKQPITPKLLRRLFPHLHFRNYADRLFWGAALLMFYSLLRRSNVLATGHSAQDGNLLRRSHITFGSNHVTLAIHTSKTRIASQLAHTIQIPARPGHRLCPVGALRVALAIAPKYKPSDSLFIWQDGTNYTYNNFMTRLRQLLQDVGENPMEYGCHSFRRGGATHAAKIGIRSEFIQKLGDWRSEAYTRYITTSPHAIDTTTPMVHKS